MTQVMDFVKKYWYVVVIIVAAVSYFVWKKAKGSK